MGLSKKNPEIPADTNFEHYHKIYLQHEPRDLFYRASSCLAELAKNGGQEITLGEAMFVLLLTWNRQAYTYNRGKENKDKKDGDKNIKFDDEIVREVELILADYAEFISRSSSLSIEDKDVQDYDGKVRDLFCQLEPLLGPVGTAKALHLLAPRMLPPLDTKIANAYGIYFVGRNKGKNCEMYLDFIKKIKANYDRLKPNYDRMRGNGKLVDSPNLLKLIDEYNFWTYTLKPALAKKEQKRLEGANKGKEGNSDV